MVIPYASDGSRFTISEHLAASASQQCVATQAAVVSIWIEFLFFCVFLLQQFKATDNFRDGPVTLCIVRQLPAWRDVRSGQIFGNERAYLKISTWSSKKGERLEVLLDYTNHKPDKWSRQLIDGHTSRSMNCLLEGCSLIVWVLLFNYFLV